MRYLLVFLLLVLAGGGSIQAIAETSVELEAERLCEKTYGNVKDSGAFDRCMKENSLTSAVSKKESQQPSGSLDGFLETLEEMSKSKPVVDENNNCTETVDRELTAAERMCDKYGYSRCSAEYETCINYAEDNGADNGGKRKKKRR